MALGEQGVVSEIQIFIHGMIFSKRGSIFWKNCNRNTAMKSIYIDPFELGISTEIDNFRLAHAPLLDCKY